MPPRYFGDIFSEISLRQHQHIAKNRGVLKMNAGTKRRLASVKTVADFYDCHPSTIWRMVQRGQLPAPVKVGNLTRWELNELGVVGVQGNAK